MKLTPEDIEQLTAEPNLIDAGTPTLYELKHALWLVRKNDPVRVWYTKRCLKWLIHRMRKEYGIVWRDPWKEK